MSSAPVDQQYILFKVGGETYGISVADTHEVVRYKEPRRIPHSAPHVLGVINLRGQIIPVVGLRERFSLDSAPQTEATRIIIAVRDGRLTGLVCDSVERVLAIPGKNIEENPDYEHKNTLSVIRGVAHLDEQDSVIFLLALDRILFDGTESVK